MKILVLGAGAIGGYFGGRLVQAGADLSFLVRERRASQLRERGLVVRSPHGDFTLPVRWTLREQIEAPVDLVLLTCKAYDLDAAIGAIAPAVGPATLVLPLLNGLAHIEHLCAAFGAARVAGASCGIPATLTPEGDVVQLGAFHRIVFGPLPGTAADAASKLGALRVLFASTPVDVELSANMTLAMWEKFVGLAALAAITCLMRASVGDILHTDEGRALVAETYAACEKTARAAGHTPREARTVEDVWPCQLRSAHSGIQRLPVDGNGSNCAACHHAAVRLGEARWLNGRYSRYCENTCRYRGPRASLPAR